MPATYTHAIYGEKVLAHLDNETQLLISEYRALYDIGLSGPDILFFYKPISKDPRGIKKIGNGMHEVAARNFFMKARDLIKNSICPDAALVYILGFINHFVLDSQCHPLINKVTAEATVSHSELESEFDALLMREKGLDPIRTKVTEHIQAKEEYANIIAPFFGITAEEVLESLKTMKMFLNIFVAPSELKRKIIYALMKKFNAYDSYQGLVFNREPREDTIEVCQILRDKMNLAIEVSVRLINEYRKTLNTDKELDERYDLNYE